MSDTPLIKGDPPAYRHPPYQGGQGGSAPPLSRGSPPPIGTPLIKGEPPAYRHPPYQGGAPRLSAPPLSRGAGGIEPKIYLQFNYNQLLKMMNITIPNLYDSDYQLWLESTINQLRQGDFQAVDWPNLLEELADLGKSERRALESLLTRLLEHLLKLTYWQYQRDYNQAGWKKEIRNFRIQIKKILKDSPSLKSYLREILQECYLDARNLLIDETELDASIRYPLDTQASHILYIPARCIIHQIGTLIIGHNERMKQSLNLGKRNNQQFVNIPHYRLIEMLTYKAQLKGIKVIINLVVAITKIYFPQQSL